MDKLAEIRPRLKRNTIFLQTSNGVFFPGEAQPFFLKGKAISHWISKLGPFMNGQYTLEDLCSGLSPERRDMLIHLITTLTEKGLLNNYVPEDRSLLPLATCKRFNTQIEYIDHYTDRPVERFKAFRESRILFIGSGETYLALTRALLRNGLQQLFLLPDAEPARYEDALQAEVASLLSSQVETTLQLVEQGYQEALSSKHAYDLVVYCADQSSLKTLSALHQWCFQHNQPFLPVLIYDQQAVLGPFVQPGQGPCWLCAQTRLAAQLPLASQSDFWRAFVLDTPAVTQEKGLFSPVAGCIGNGLAFEIFKLLTGALPSQVERGMIVQHLETLEAVECKLLPYPLCPICSHASVETELEQLTAFVAGQHDCLLEQEELLKTAAPHLMNAQSGPFLEFADEDLVQLPLKVTRLLAQHLDSPLARRLEVNSYSLEYVLHARFTAMATMTGLYAQTLPDARRMVFANIEQMHAAGRVTIAPEALTTFSGIQQSSAKTHLAWYPAYSLLRQQICYVPAAAVYPHSGLNAQGLFERTTAGEGTGTTFQQVMLSGLLSACAYEQTRRILQGENTLARLHLSELASTDPNLVFLVNSLLHMHEYEVAVFEVLHDEPFHLLLAFATIEARTLTWCGAGLAGSEALTELLSSVLGDLQLLQCEGNVPETHAPLDFSPHAELLLASPMNSRLLAPALSFEEFTNTLHERQCEVLVAHTTPSDIGETHTWMSGTVLLARPASQPHTAA